jgi:hypothetical protein
MNLTQDEMAVDAPFCMPIVFDGVFRRITGAACEFEDEGKAGIGTFPCPDS